MSLAPFPNAIYWNWATIFILGFGNLVRIKQTFGRHEKDDVCENSLLYNCNSHRERLISSHVAWPERMPERHRSVAFWLAALPSFWESLLPTSAPSLDTIMAPILSMPNLRRILVRPSWDCPLAQNGKLLHEYIRDQSVACCVISILISCHYCLHSRH